jgi:hypothetical protein
MFGYMIANLATDGSDHGIARDGRTSFRLTFQEETREIKL